MSLSITPLYAGLLTLLFIALSVRVILWRRSALISLGDGDDKEMRKRMRVQSNCAEYAPIGLLLLGFAELQGAPGWGVHLMGLVLLAGRVMHAIGMSSNPQIIPLRVYGMVLTFAMLVCAALANISHAIF